MNCLILGAGLMQKVAILSAKESGFRTCVVDADPQAVSIPFADEFRQIDLKDKDGILAYAKELQEKEGLSCVFTAGTDFSASVSYVCEKLNLPGHSYEASLNSSVKTRMRECFKKENVPSPEFFSISKNDLTHEKIQEILSKINFPMVVKPVDNMGARGCRLIRNENEFEPSVIKALSCSRSCNAIVEEYMEGPEYSIDALIYNGTFTVTGFAIRHIKYPPYFIEVGHTMPCEISKKEHDQLISVFALGAKALGLTCGCAKADIKFTEKGPMIGEIAARLSGGYMSGWTYPYASDFQLTKQAIIIQSGGIPEALLSLRKKVTFTPSELCSDSVMPYELFEVPCKRISAERAWLSIPGTVQNIEDIKDFTDKAVTDILPRSTVNPGSVVSFPRNNVEKCGNVIAVSHDAKVAVEAAEDAVSNVFITLEPDDVRTEAFLNCEYEEDEDKFPPFAYAELSLEQLSKISGKFKANDKLKDNIPDFLKEKPYKSMVDWNYNTIEQTAKKFDILRPVHKAIDNKKIWKAIMRGGLQGAVYVCDSEK